MPRSPAEPALRRFLEDLAWRASESGELTALGTVHAHVSVTVSGDGAIATATGCTDGVTATVRVPKEGAAHGDRP